jgi:hypothetical protein
VAATAAENCLKRPRAPRSAQKKPRSRGASCSNGKLFASAALLTLCRLLLLGGARLAAGGRGLVSALVLLGRRRLAHALIPLRCLARAALSAGRGLASLASTLVLLRRRLLAAGRRLVGALVLLRGCLLRAALCRAGAALARCRTTLRATLRARHVRQPERCDGLIVDAAARLEALLLLERGDRLHGPRAEHAIDLDAEPPLPEHGLDLPDLIGTQVQRDRSATAAAQMCPAGRNAEDVEWITMLAQQRRDWMVATGDDRIRKNNATRAAYRSAELSGFVFAPAYQKTPMHQVASFMLWRWPEMEQLFRLVGGAALYELPMNR